MRLDYARPAKMPGVTYSDLDPGACSWNPLGFSNHPPEPGVVYFDVYPEAQPWSATHTRVMDTTANAAAHYPDPISLPRYFNDPANLWVFFVEDANHFSASFGSFGPNRPPPRMFTITGSLAPTATGPAELLCRGGGGHAFRRGNSAGTNLVWMTLGYVVSRRQAGNDGSGLAVGTCAWTTRSGVKAEPGQIRFVTAKDAASKARAGMSSAPAPNAAEQYPDANTIPVYLNNPAHYWSFRVDKSRLDSARTHGVWKTAVAAATGPLSKASPTRSGASAGTGTTPGGTRSPGNSTLNAAGVGLTFQEVVRKPNEYVIRFTARTGWKIRVMYGTQPHTYAKNTITGAPYLNRPSGGTDVPVRLMSQRGFAGEYSTAPLKNLAQGTTHYFGIFAYNEYDTPMEYYAGEFVTMTQTVTVHFTSVRILNDSDKMSAGDIGFRFFVAPASAQKDSSCIMANVCESGFDGRSWETGQSHPLGNVVTLSPSSGRVRVWVKGWDWDVTNRYLSTGPGGSRYLDAGGSSPLGDWNIARQEFDTGASPTQLRVGYPFRLRSIDGSVFMFEVEGYVEVVRQ